MGLALRKEVYLKCFFREHSIPVGDEIPCQRSRNDTFQESQLDLVSNRFVAGTLVYHSTRISTLCRLGAWLYSIVRARPLLFHSQSTNKSSLVTLSFAETSFGSRLGL